MATSNTVLLLPLLLLPAQVCHDSCDDPYAASLQRITRWPNLRHQQCCCLQSATDSTSHSTAGLSASCFTLLAEFELCVTTLCVPTYHVIVCIMAASCIIDCLLCAMTCVSAKGFPNSCNACGCQVVYCLPGLQMTTTMGMVGTTTMTTSVATTVMSMATTSALVDLQLLQQLVVLQLLHLPLADASFRQSTTMATTTTMREVLLQLLQLHQVAMVHLLLQLPLQVQAGLPEHCLYD